MAYGLKYKASKTHENGDKYEVRIYRDGWTGASYGIGNLTRLSLSIQGDTAALTAPIIKTSLNIGMIDTPDKGSTKSDGTTCVDANGDKVGKWEEFYTNNPTLYKVELRYTGALTRNAVIWTGFLTPDSWGEDMTYGGTISLVARDMLGTLSEYEFDLTGDVTITQIVQGALTKCKCAMTATMRTSECLQNAGNSQSILAAKINASTFAGKSWYDALEQTLEGVGLILRYDGNNGFDCTSIRYAASHAVEGGENAHTPAFYNRSGYRTLDPAVKQIVEVFNPSIESIAPVEPGADDWTDTGQTLTQKFKNHLGQESTYSYPKMSLSAQGVDYSGTGALPYYENTYIYNGTTGELLPTFRAPLYIPINLQSSADFLTLKNAAFVPPFNLSFSNPMGSTGYLLFTPAEGSSPRVLTNTYSRDFEQKVRFRITCKKNNTTYYWDTSGAGAWGTTEKVLEYVTGERIQVAELEGATDYAIGVNTIVVPAPASATDFYPARAAFIPLVYEVAPIDGNDVYGEYKTTTIYDEENHIEINRTPSIGAINSSTPAAFLPNVLHYGTTPARDRWRWAGENSAGLPLAVVIHQQLLVFNCAQNGNSIFTGDLLDLTSGVSVPGTNYDYFTRSCALLAGDYNCLSGYIEGVTLREIYDWDDVWDGVTPEYTEKESQAKGGTAASGGGGGSTGGGGGSSHTHANKEVLDGITAEKVTSWDDAVTLAHSHSNKTVLDGISSTDITAWNGAASKAHEHANKTILDAIQEASITHWDAAYAHSQIGVAATTPSGNPHNTTWAQIYSASGNAKILTDYIGDNQVTIEKLESALSWLSHCHYSNGTLVLGDENNAINFAAYGEITAGGVGQGGGGGAAVWGGIEGTLSNQTDLWNVLQGKQNSLGTGTNGQILSWQNGAPAWVAAPATGVTTFNNRSGAVTLSSTDVTTALGYTPVNKAGDTLSGTLLRTDNASPVIKVCGDINFTILDIKDTVTSTGYGFELNYLGAQSGNDNSLELVADNQIGTKVKAFTLTQDGVFKFAKVPNVNGTNVALTSDIPTSIVNTLGGKTGTIGIGSGLSVTSTNTLTNTGVLSFGGQTGAITVRGGLTANGSVNLAMSGTSGKELQASIVGLGNLAYLNGLSKGDVGLGNVDNTADANKLVYGILTNNTSQGGASCYDASPGLHFYRYNGDDNTIGGGDGWILQWSWNQGSVGGQIYLDDNPSKTIGIRGRNPGSSFTSWSKIALTSDIPTTLSQLSADTTHRLVTDSQITAWNAKWDYNENTIKAVKVNNAGNADTLENHSASYFQPLATAINTGNIASQKVAALLYNYYGSGLASIPYSGGEAQYGIVSSGTDTALDYASQYTFIQLPWVTSNFGGRLLFGINSGKIGFQTLYNSSWSAIKEIYHSGNCNDFTTNWDAKGLRVGGVDGYHNGYGLELYYTTNDEGFGEARSVIQAYSRGAAYGDRFHPLRLSGSKIIITQGNVGIGTPSPSEKLHVAGNVLATGEVTAGSDSRWKDNQTPVLNGIDIIRQLRPMTWTWNEKFADKNYIGKQSAGLIAQQVASVLPFAVRGNEENGYTLDYNVFHAYEISALQSHETRIERLERENRELRQQIQRLQINS